MSVYGLVAIASLFLLEPIESIAELEVNTTLSWEGIAVAVSGCYSCLLWLESG